MRLSIRHITHYRFDQPVAHGLQRLRLVPKSTHGQQVLDWNMELAGAVAEVAYEDHHHNRVTLVTVVPGVTELTVTCAGLVDTADNSGVLGPHTGHIPLWTLLDPTALTKPGARMRQLVQDLKADRADTLGTLHRLSAAVLEAVAYEAGHTSPDTTAEAVLETGRGVCQDHTHVFLGCARLLGIPARYVSGYLMMDDCIEQEAGHAWAEAHVPGLGWVGFDVANAICPDERYVRVASGRDYAEAAPVTGLSYGAGESALKVSLAVEQQLVEQ